MVKWNGIELGEYQGPGLLSPIISKFRQGEFNQKFIYYLVEKAAPYQNFQIYDGLSHWCYCGKIDLDTRNFLGHIKDHHHGIIQKNCQLNRPPWYDWIKFKNQEIEDEFCFTLSNLENFKLDD